MSYGWFKDSEARLSTNTCGHRWYGPRADVPEAFANHVCCKRPEFLHARHRCVCGAETEPE